MAAPAAGPTRLAEVEAELTRLRHQHDIAMSRFRFEEATALGPALAALERERDTLAAALPPPDNRSGVVPVLVRPRRPRSRRR